MTNIKHTPRGEESQMSGYSRRPARFAGWYRGGVAAGLVAILAGCDYSVTNPGPMQDAALDDPAAHEALVAGMSQNLSRAVWITTYYGAEASAEYVQAGRVFVTKLPILPYQLTREQIPAGVWNNSQQARWVAEDGVRRFKETVENFSSYDLGAEALVWAGYANRLLADNFCEAVINGGAPEPTTVYQDRAIAHFTEAIQVASNVENNQARLAALAGRASAYALAGRWNEAMSDAAQVPDDFAFQAQFNSQFDGQYNDVYWSNSNTPFRAHSVWSTDWEDYYLETGDPRVRWGTDPEVPTGEFAHVPWYFQLKYTSRDDDINLSSGAEMRLIQAEGLLRGGDWQGALNVINDLRTGVISDHDEQPLTPWAAANEADVWTALMRERGAVLWLEGRRMGDFRRWIADGVPGEMEDMSDRVRLCFPIPTGEINTNENLTDSHQDPVNPIFTG